MTLTLGNVSKSFPGQKALSEVDLTVRYGEVHALLGQNGSGKSTLVKLLAGYHEPDSGSSAHIDGRPFGLGSAEAARAAGLRFVHQDLGLVLTMSLLDNMMLGRPYPTGFGKRIRRRVAAERVRAQLTQLGIDADPREPVGRLSLAERAGVAIGRALSDPTEGKAIVVLDEPTATLPADQALRLLDTIDRLRADGHGILLVSHHLDQVLRIADRVTVLRDGRVAASVSRQDIDYDGLTELIVGHRIDTVTTSEREVSAIASNDEPALRVTGLRGARVDRVSFEVRAGEIVGVAGINGSGRESLAPLITGHLPNTGQVLVNGQPLASGDPLDAMRKGVANVPGERGRYGLFGNFSVRCNMTISDMSPHRGADRRIRRTAEKAEVRMWIKRLNIVTQGTEAPIASLSGGNQQKVLVARALRLHPKVLVLDDPALGIDIGARAQIHRVIEQCATDGMAILLVSTDSDEIARLSDRVLIFAQGRIAREISRGPDTTPESIDMLQLSLIKTVQDAAAATEKLFEDVR